MEKEGAGKHWTVRRKHGKIEQQDHIQNMRKEELGDEIAYYRSIQIPFLYWDMLSPILLFQPPKSHLPQEVKGNKHVVIL